MALIVAGDFMMSLLSAVEDTVIAGTAIVHDFKVDFVVRVDFDLKGNFDPFSGRVIVLAALNRVGLFPGLLIV